MLSTIEQPVDSSQLQDRNPGYHCYPTLLVFSLCLPEAYTDQIARHLKVGQHQTIFQLIETQYSFYASHWYENPLLIEQ